jgi:hypothetical protein
MSLWWANAALKSSVAQEEEKVRALKMSLMQLQV